jgi:hypothetical protein
MLQMEISPQIGKLFDNSLLFFKNLTQKIAKFPQKKLRHAPYFFAENVCALSKYL